MADQGLPVANNKKKKGSSAAAARGFMCGCGGAKSVSVVSRLSTAGNISPATTTPLTTTSSATATSSKTTRVTSPAPTTVHDAEGTPSVDTLLMQLRELERGVRALGVREDRGIRATLPPPPPPPPPRHRRSASDWGASSAGRRRRGRLEEESVAVVRESDDPLGDFRRSMVQMIVENEITATPELRELLHRFLSLNSSRHHHLILRAFADVCEELFAGAGQHNHHHHHHRPRRRPSKPPPYSATTTS
uniref:Transcription repressor n=1 Tax=Oryza punctata TaxID=4537 RepID=A0A0E0K874_ORYPU